MKTIKQTILATASFFAVTASFAQVGLGITGNAGASATKSVNAAHATTRATQVAAKASAQATASTQKAVQNAGARGAEARSAAGAKAQVVAGKVRSASKETVAAKPDVQAATDLTSEGRLEVSGKGKEKSFGVISNDASVNAGATVAVNNGNGIGSGNEVKDAPGKTLKLATKAERKAAAKAARAADKVARKKDKAKTEGREKAQASIKASENAKEHASEQSAVFGAKGEVSSQGEVKRPKGSVETRSKSEVRAKGKVSKS